MASEVEICNNGLTKIGSTRILSLDDENKQGRLCKVAYPHYRDVVLRSHLWKFATKRQQLAQSTTTPAYRWAFEYPLPANNLRLIEPDIHDYPYIVEGNSILTDEGTVFIRYIRRVTDPNEMDVSFQEALACRLAFEFSIPLTDDKTDHRLMEKRYERALSEARMVGAMEDLPPTIEMETWLKARYAGTSGPTGVFETGND